MRLCLAVLTVLLGTVVATAASAHSFDTIFIVPVSGKQAGAGQQAQDGFLFAARERDGHPGETADGHLGGLDVYLRIVDGAADTGDVSAQVIELAGRAADDVPWIVGPADLLAALRIRIAAAEWLPIDLSEAGPADIRTMDGRPFAATFESAFGYAPTLAVIAGYGVARRIDETVRARN